MSAPAPQFDAWLGMSGSQRRDLRSDAIRHAVYLHSDTGDAMVVLAREEAARDVIATAEQFYQWVVAEEAGA